YTTLFRSRELHLELAFLGAGPLGENVQDQLRPVDDGQFQELLQVPGLCRGQLVVDDDQVRAQLPSESLGFAGFTHADVGGGQRPVEPLHNAPHHLPARAAHEFRQLVQPVVDADQQHSLARRGPGTRGHGFTPVVAWQRPTACRRRASAGGPALSRNAPFPPGDKGRLASRQTRLFVFYHTSGRPVTDWGGPPWLL